jgi:hypothetical protein
MKSPDQLDGGDTKGSANPHSFTSGTQKALFRLARGTCYFPACRRAILTYESGEPLVDVQIAHIAAAEPGGPRFDASMTDEQRRSIDNLILLCQAHHNLVDKVRPEDFPADELRRWKSENEDPALRSALLAASINDANLEQTLMSIASAVSPTRSATVELSAAVLSGNQALTAPVQGFAEVFGSGAEFNDWGLAIVISVRNKGQLDIVVESVSLHWSLDGVNSPAVFYPPVHSRADRLPHRVADGGAGHWPIAAANIRGNVQALQNAASVVSVKAVVTLSSGEQFESASMLFDDLVRAGLGISQRPPA